MSVTMRIAAMASAFLPHRLALRGLDLIADFVLGAPERVEFTSTTGERVAF